MPVDGRRLKPADRSPPSAHAHGRSSGALRSGLALRSHGHADQARMNTLHGFEKAETKKRLLLQSLQDLASSASLSKHLKET